MCSFRAILQKRLYICNNTTNLIEAGQKSNLGHRLQVCKISAKSVDQWPSYALSNTVTFTCVTLYEEEVLEEWQEVILNLLHWLTFACLSADTETIIVENVTENFKILQDCIFVFGPLIFDLAPVGQTVPPPGNEKNAAKCAA